MSKRAQPGLALMFSGLYCKAGAKQRDSTGPPRAARWRQNTRSTLLPVLGSVLG
jgi:hypothetical protein